MKIGIKLGAVISALLFGQSAWAIPATYTISTYSVPGYSASWLHTLNDACNVASDLDLNRNGSADVLHQCGDNFYAVDGYLSGDWDGEKLTITGGQIKDTGVVGGSLGGAFYSSDMQPLWTILTAKWGTFIFEDLGPSLNSITADSLLLWGQNLAGYSVRTDACPGRNACKPKALALYATTSVPEPTAIALFALGMGAVTWTMRRKAARQD